MRKGFTTNPRCPPTLSPESDYAGRRCSNPRAEWKGSEEVPPPKRHRRTPRTAPLELVLVVPEGLRRRDAEDLPRPGAGDCGSVSTEFASPGRGGKGNPIEGADT